mmetsp:Transcript_12051/g.24467  ORF Transcript_12051/g.24467 Transcript_12051/m.24467 type:complete len:261 (-) Transcript_12051:510-1292(-)
MSETMSPHAAMSLSLEHAKTTRSFSPGRSARSLERRCDRAEGLWAASRMQGTEVGVVWGWKRQGGKASMPRDMAESGMGRAAKSGVSRRSLRAARAIAEFTLSKSSPLPLRSTPSTSSTLLMLATPTSPATVDMVSQGTSGPTRAGLEGLNIPAFSLPISSTVSPNILVCSNPMLVTTLKLGSTTFVASSLPPNPVSSTMQSTSCLWKCWRARAVVISKNVAGIERDLQAAKTEGRRSQTASVDIGEPRFAGASFKPSPP